MWDGRRLLHEGYARHKEEKSLFRLSSLENELIVVSDPEKFAEYVAAPDDVLSQMEPVNNVRFLFTFSFYFFFSSNYFGEFKRRKRPYPGDVQKKKLLTGVWGWGDI